jgi:hypothetical protein
MRREREKETISRDRGQWLHRMIAESREKVHKKKAGNERLLDSKTMNAMVVVPLSIIE